MPRTSGSAAGTSAAGVWSYVGRWLTDLFPHLLLYDIRLDGGTTQVLESGLYTLVPMTDVYVVTTFNVAAMHVEMYNGVAWKDYLITGIAIPTTFLCDGTNFRAANGAAAGTWYRLEGVRAW